MYKSPIQRNSNENSNKKVRISITAITMMKSIDDNNVNNSNSYI